MPIYQCYPPQGLLTKAAKTHIAEEIASIHCNPTGAPRSFVNVLFLELPHGDCFVAGGNPATRSFEVDPANAMEAGLILPEPGSEQQWFDHNRDRLTQLGWITA
jgi:phenylpyruvate tautomerase PptA (4-oxalocrotonate tautomerase family)